MLQQLILAKRFRLLVGLGTAGASRRLWSGGRCEPLADIACDDPDTTIAFLTLAMTALAR
jgi:hypothetical protein